MYRQNICRHWDIKTERQNITLSKKAKIIQNCSSEGRNANSNITKYFFSNNNPEFKDGLHLRFGLEPSNTPRACP